MAKIEIPHNPAMTQQCLYALFQDAFDEKYEVYYPPVTTRFFIVRQSACAGVAVWLEQNGRQTFVRYQRFAPARFLRRLTRRSRGFFARRVVEDVSSLVMSLRPQPL